MPRTNTAELILGANASRLKSGLRNSQRHIHSFSTRSKRMLTGIGTGLKRTLTSIPGQLGLIGGTAGLFMLGKSVVAFDDKLNRLGIQGSMTKKKLFALREEMFYVGLESGKSRTEIVAGLDAIVQRTGNIDWAVASYKDLAIVSQATGAAMADLGAMGSQLDEKFKIKPTGLMDALDILTGQGKAGSFTLENMATQGERLLTAANRLDMSGLKDLTRLGAFVQMARSGTGSAEQAVTAVERTISNIITKEKQVSKIFNIRDANKNFKSLDTILKGIISATKGDEAILGKLFGEEGVRAVSPLAKAFRDTGEFGRFDKLLSGNYSGVIAADMQSRTEALTFQLNRMVVLGEQLGDSLMGSSLEKFNNNLQEILADPQKLEDLNKNFKEIGKTIGSVAGAIGFLLKHWKLLLSVTAGIKIGSLAFKFLGNKKGGLGGLAGAAGGAGIPVFVTNMAGGGLAAGGFRGLVDQFGNPMKTSPVLGVGGASSLVRVIGLVGPFAVGLAALVSVINRERDLMEKEKEIVEIGSKLGFSPVFSTSEKSDESQFAPVVNLSNQIRLNVVVDNEGNVINAKAQTAPSPGKIGSLIPVNVKTATFLDDIFVGGEK